MMSFPGLSFLTLPGFSFFRSLCSESWVMRQTLNKCSTLRSFCSIQNVAASALSQTPMGDFQKESSIKAETKAPFWVTSRQLSLVSIWSSGSSQSSQELFRRSGRSYGNATQTIASHLYCLDRIVFYRDDRDNCRLSQESSLLFQNSGRKQS